MGRIKSLMVKRAAKQLIEKKSIDFSELFNDNKKILGANFPSKSVRNKIAGYIARVVKMRRIEREKPVVKKIPVEETSLSFKPTHADKYY